MKKLLIVLTLLLCASYACAHPGRTDASGGHTNHSTGEYHYHHGYPAHQHDGGVCPYDFDDKTGQSSGSSSISTAKRISNDNFLYSFLENGDRGEDVRMLQERLNALGYSCGAADGIFGAKTEAALKAFQEDEYLPSHGWASYLTMCRLFPELAPTPTPKPTSTPRPTSTPKPTNKPKKTPFKSKSNFFKTNTFMYLAIGFALFSLPIWGLIEFLYESVLKARNRKFMAQYRFTIEQNQDLELFIEGHRMHSTENCKFITGSLSPSPIRHCVGYPAIPCPHCMSNIDLTNAIVQKRKSDERNKLIAEKLKQPLSDKFSSELINSGAVYISTKGNRPHYHNSFCSYAEDPVLVFKKSAIDLGLTQCPHCTNRPAHDIMVAVSPYSRSLYHHRHNNCISSDNQYLIFIGEAKKRNLFYCSKCLHYPVETPRF